MWKEIFANDKNSIDKWLNVWNNREDCPITHTQERMIDIKTRQKDVHYYIYNGEDFKIILMYKFLKDENLTYVFFYNSTLPDYIMPSDEVMAELWKVNREFLQMLLSKYNRPVMWMKVEKRFQTPKWKDIVFDKIPLYFLQFNIKASQFENYWIYEDI